MYKIVAMFLWLGVAGGALAQAPVYPQPDGQPQQLKAYVTGYSYWDTTPPGTVEISHPVRHQYAGGMGTYSNPVTLAVGHQIIDGNDMLDFPAGTIFYLPRLRKYAIVEDTCGDSPAPQGGPCHGGYRGLPWVDIYVDGVSAAKEISDDCMTKITAIQRLVMDPAPTMSVVVGPVTEGGCFIFPDDP